MDEIIWIPGMSLETLERQVIQRAFRHFRQNKTLTANSLGIAVRTLDSKLDKYGANVEKLKEAEDTAARFRHDQLQRARGIKLADGFNYNHALMPPSQGPFAPEQPQVLASSSSPPPASPSEVPQAAAQPVVAPEPVVLASSQPPAAPQPTKAASPASLDLRDVLLSRQPAPRRSK